MGLFFPDDGYSLSRRQYGFNRYKQLMSLYAFQWMKVNLITVVGGLPLLFGLSFAILTSSILVLIPVSLVGGAVFGPFLAGMVDAVMRGLRDAPGKWSDNYKKSWKQNWRSSLVPGAVFGLVVGIYTFMVYVMWAAEVFPGWGTLALYLFGAMLLLGVNALFWPQLVLFEQSALLRFKNIILFMIRYFWRVMGVSLLQLLMILVYLLLAPWSLLLVPFLGWWFLIFLTQYNLYEKLDEALHIDEQFFAVEGDPWEEEEPDETEAMIGGLNAMMREPEDY